MVTFWQLTNKWTNRWTAPSHKGTLTVVSGTLKIEKGKGLGAWIYIAL